MVNKNFWLGILVIVLVFGMMVVGCNNGSTGSGNDGSLSGNDGSLNGTWNHSINPVTLVISGSSYTQKEAGVNYGKGEISYNGSTITIVSTHAWTGSYWTPYSETCTASYILSGDSLTVSGVSGYYSYMNGIWTK